VAVGLAEDDPLAVREYQEEVAHPGYWTPPRSAAACRPSVVERDPIQIVAEGLLLDGELGTSFSSTSALFCCSRCWAWWAVVRANAISVPSGSSSVGLHVLRVVGARQRRVRLRLAIVDDEDAFDREEELRDHDVGDGDETDRSFTC
jgi:hypothetical protein